MMCVKMNALHISGCVKTLAQCSLNGFCSLYWQNNRCQSEHENLTFVLQYLWGPLMRWSSAFTTGLLEWVVGVPSKRRNAVFYLLWQFWKYKVQCFDWLQLHRSATTLKLPQWSSWYNAMFCGETLGPGIHMDATYTHTNTDLEHKTTSWQQHSDGSANPAG